MVTRWSDTPVWNNWFWALRSSPAAFKLISVSATSACNLAMSSSSTASKLARDVCFSSRSSFSCWATLISSSVVSNSFLQNSSFSFSCFCWAFSSSTILSIMTFTFANSSSFTRAAKDPSAMFLCFRATAATRSPARSRARRTDAATEADELVCNKLIVLPKSSRASSCVRIFNASPRAAISSVRTFTRALYSSASVVQPSVMSIMNCWSADNVASAAVMSFFAVALLATRSARVLSFCLVCWVAAAISASFAAFSASNCSSA
mmetsp:Transcript_3095/g.7920  ORF Transcript_3095/g.7920 Transcript_3095/m.7920 type:complete len:263 (+) Transcript_3095:609-1397(+)